MNIIKACSECNSLKGNLTPQEFKEFLNRIIASNSYNNKFSKDRIELVLLRNDLLIEKISSYISDLCKGNIIGNAVFIDKLKEPIKRKKKVFAVDYTFSETEKFSELLKKNTDKIKYEAERKRREEKQKKPTIEYCKEQWSKEQFDNFFAGMIHFHCL